MKIEGTARAAALRTTSAYARRLEVIESAGAPDESAAVASIAGIPEAEFTPRVRDAITRLMGEVDQLRHDLKRTQARLEEAERAADQDHLLPLFNRRAFVRELTRSIGVSSRYGTPSSLVYFDLDGFKQVNDTYGHAAGDALLAHVAHVLTQNVRDSDVVARLGGDEFGVILVHTAQAQSEAKAASLAARLAESPALWLGKPIDIAFSYGVLELTPGDSADSAMARADALMYSQKRAAR